MMTFAAGLLDGVTLLSHTHTTTTHMSGKVLKTGTYAAVGSSDAITPNLSMVLSFLFGAILSGIATATPERKTPRTCARGCIVVGIGCCCVGLMLTNKIDEAKYAAAFTAGMQNALLTTITGFMRTTHFTGTVTDVGLLIGQAYPLKVKDAAHIWKTKVLSTCIVVWVAAGLASGLLVTPLGASLAFVPGIIGIGCGLAGLVVINKEEAKVKVEEAAAAAEEEARAVAEKEEEKVRWCPLEILNL